MQKSSSSPGTPKGTGPTSAEPRAEIVEELLKSALGGLPRQSCGGGGACRAVAAPPIVCDTEPPHLP